MALLVCGVDDLPRSSMTTVMNGDTPVVVAHTGAGGYHAVRGWCAHQGAMLGGGRLTWLTEEDPDGGYALSRAGEILRCPWHSFEYDVTTGRCVTDPKLRLRTYPVRIEDGNVVVDVPLAGAAR